MLSVEDWAEIRRLHRSEGLPIKAIARVMGVSRNTVRAAVASDGPPKYERARKGSIVDAVEPRIRELLRAYPSMPATVIAERVGWTRSIRVLSARVAELRPVYLPPDPVSRTSYVAGQIAQCDLWFPPIMLPVGFGQVRKPAQLPVLTMITGYARWLLAVRGCKIFCGSGRAMIIGGPEGPGRWKGTLRDDGQGAGCGRGLGGGGGFAAVGGAGLAGGY